ncbi:MAG: tetratricopeptide repeat protein [Victivallaceae bacterium]|nr:tetratricopeptide repeat protein [Victivallaceae bacterium]
MKRSGSFLRFAGGAVLIAVVACSASAVEPEPSARGNTTDRLREQALAGDFASQLTLGGAYLHGAGGRVRNPALAVYYFRLAAHGGSAEGRYNLGVCQEYGLGIDKSLLDAFESYSAAGELLPEARFRKAMLLRKGIASEMQSTGKVRLGVEPDPEAAQKILSLLAEAGYAPAQREIAAAELRAALRTGGEEGLRAGKLAYAKLERAALRGDPPAMRMLADCFRSGVFCRKDSEAMFFYLEKAAAKGDAEAMAKLAFCYETGDGTAPDRERANQFFQRAAEKDNPMALAKLGDYALLEGNLTEAVEYFQQAARLGSGYGGMRLALLLADGVGIAKDEQKAAASLLEAARAGSSDAAYYLALFFYAGRGIPKDDSAGLYWMKRAAADGVAAAEEFLRRSRTTSGRGGVQGK